MVLTHLTSRALLAAVVLCGALVTLTACVERTISITSDPPGALVQLNDQEVGRTPLTIGFTYYGVYDVRLQHDDCKPLLTQKATEAPWWEAPGPDLVVEAIPGAKSDQRWHFQLEPKPDSSVDALLQNAIEMRESITHEDPESP
jgi:hypothetical protein